MAITSTSGASVSNVADQLFKTADANSDGRLSTNEFQSFLETLLGSMAKKTGGIGSAAAASAGTAKSLDATTAPRVYQAMVGFDYVKLNTPAHTTPKYVFARATQDIGFPFDHVISVQEAGYFKPHWKTYAKAEELVGRDRSSCLFVANHAFDCIGAKSFGMRTAFIDRRKRPFGETPHQPDLIVADFAALAAALC